MGRKCGILAGKPRRVTRCRGAWTGGRSGTGRLLESLAANPGPARARNRARRTATPCKRAKRIVITIVLIVAILPMFLLFWLMSGDDENFATIDHGQSYGNSIYKRYQDAVYAAVPSNGYYRIDAADPASFQAFDTGAFDGRQAGRDQRHVYCGNLILPDLRPASARYLGNNYFSDGAATYFCSMHSRLNRELEPLDEFWQKILHRAGAGPKPQTYLYPYVALPASARPYRPLLDRDLATDGARAFYRGLEMPQANPATLRRVPAGRDGDVRPSDDFFADGSRVYFHEQPLPLSDDPALHAFMVGDLYRQPYLRDPRDGMVYVGAQPFDAAHAPYRLINEKGRHVYQALFASKDGLYFYNTQTRQLERAGDDPFASGRMPSCRPTSIRTARRRCSCGRRKSGPVPPEAAVAGWCRAPLWSTGCGTRRTARGSSAASCITTSARSGRRAARSTTSTRWGHRSLSPTRSTRSWTPSRRTSSCARKRRGRSRPTISAS